MKQKLISGLGLPWIALNLTAADFTVTTRNDGGSGSLREIIAAAPPGSTIKFAPNVVGLIPVSQGEIVIDKDLTIEGPGRGVLALDALNNSRLFYVQRGVVTISGLTLRNAFFRAADGADAGSAFEPGQPGAPARGAAILNFGELTVSDCLLQNHRVVGGTGGDGAPDLPGAPASRGGSGGEAAGGAIYNGHRLVIANSTIEGGFAVGGSGGYGGDSIYAANAFAGQGGNGSGGLGGGIYNIGTMMASNCLFLRCEARGGSGRTGGDASTFNGRVGGSGGRGGAGHGGALYNVSTALVVNCTFNLNDGVGGNGGNGANGITRDGIGGDGGDSFGGAIFNRDHCQVTLINDTVVSCDVVGGNEGFSPEFNNNGSRGTGIGGGVYDESLADTRLLNTLVAFNTANTSHHDVFGVVASLGHNFIRIQDLSLGWNTTDKTGSLISPLDPQILPFGDNGGPSPTVMPRRGSPLVDGGDFAVLSAPWEVLTDQRGAYRRAGSGVDIGAVEAPYGSARAVVNTNDSGFGSLREALVEAQADAGGNSAFVYFAPWVLGQISLTSGELPIGNTILFGPGADKLAISGNYRSRVLRAARGNSQSGVWHLTICDGLVQENISANYGGGILAEAPLTLVGCVISNNTVVGRPGPDGSGLANGQRGGDAFGGGVHYTRELHVNECIVTANWALGGNGGNGRNGGWGGGGFGGGISGTNETGTSLSSLFFMNSLVQGNTSRGGRGGIARSGVTPSGVGGEGGYAFGGGAYIATATPVVDPLSLWMDRCTLSGNHAIGGLGGTGRQNATDGGDGEGGSGGTALGGGAVLNLPVRLIHCTVSGNRAQGGTGGDGGFVNGVRAEAGSGGTAAGGGILRSPSHPGGMSNCTVTANAALAGLSGLTTNDARLFIGTGVGGGVWDSDGGAAQMTVLSSIVAGNQAVGLGTGGLRANADWTGPCISAGYNLIGITNASTGFGAIGAIGDKLGRAASPLNPRLGPLQDNGGNVPTNRPFPHLTHALLPGSPAIDAGKSSQSLDQRGALREFDDPTVPNAPGGDGSDIGAVEDGQVRIVGLRNPNQNPSVQFTTLPARRHFLESEDALVPPQWMPIGSSLFGNGGIGELPDTGPPAANRFYRVRAEVGTRPVVYVYANDFENVIGPEWNVAGPIATTPVSARKFLGEFGNETVTLQLAGLPPHTQIKVSFDLFILKSWDGNRTDFGPDRWMLAVRDGVTLVDTTFAQYADGTQAFPGSVGASYEGLTGAIERGTLGYVFGGLQTDSVYRLNATFDHTAAILTLDFRGLNLQEIGDESWGLDNVRVEAIHTP